MPVPEGGAAIETSPASAVLIRGASQSLSAQLATLFAARIRDHLWLPGARLPSVRQCAAQYGVNASTVVAAYDHLQAQGWVVARKNSGFYVREADGPSRLDRVQGEPMVAPGGGVTAGAVEAAGAAAASQAQRSAPPIKATSLIRGMFQAQDSRLQPGMGVLPAEWLETDFLPRLLRKATAASDLHALSLRYGEPQGDERLRRALTQKLSQLQLRVQPEQIVTTVGATQALDIASRTLLKTGDCVMVEEPGWAVEFARLQLLGMRVLPVPRDAHGPDLAVMQRYCEVHSPKMLVSVSVLHNPTGLTLSPARAHQVVRLAHEAGFYMVEDDSYSAFAPEHATRLSVLDGLQRSIYISGFSKILAPNWRVGYAAASPEMAERLLDTKLLSTLSTPAVLERTLALCLEQGLLRRHAERLRLRLDRARARCVKLALQHGCRFVHEPAGLFGWVDAGVDTEQLAMRMHEEGYLVAPGSLFLAERKPSMLMRINVATTQDLSFWKDFVRCRAQVLRQQG